MDLVQNRVDLVLQSNLELLLHGLVQVMLLAEVLSQRLGSVTLIDDNLLNAVLGNVDLNVKLRVSFVNLLGHALDLLANVVLLDWFVLLRADVVQRRHGSSNVLFLVPLSRSNDFSMESLGRLGRLLLARRDSLVTIRSELSVSVVIRLHLRSFLSSLVHSLGGGVRVSAGHELLEVLLVPRSLHSIDVLPHSLLLEGINIGVDLSGLGGVGLETALLGRFLELIVDSALVLPLAWTLGHEIEIGVDVSSGGLPSYNKVVDLGLESELLPHLVLHVLLNLVQFLLLSLSLSGTKQVLHNIESLRRAADVLPSPLSQLLGVLGQFRSESGVLPVLVLLVVEVGVGHVLVESVQSEHLEMGLDRAMLSLSEVKDTTVLVVSTAILPVGDSLVFVWDLNTWVPLPGDNHENVLEVLSENLLLLVALEQVVQIRDLVLLLNGELWLEEIHLVHDMHHQVVGKSVIQRIYLGVHIFAVSGGKLLVLQVNKHLSELLLEALDPILLRFLKRELGVGSPVDLLPVLKTLLLNLDLAHFVQVMQLMSVTLIRGSGVILVVLLFLIVDGSGLISELLLTLGVEPLVSRCFVPVLHLVDNLLRQVQNVWSALYLLQLVANGKLLLLEHLHRSVLEEPLLVVQEVLEFSHIRGVGVQDGPLAFERVRVEGAAVELSILLLLSEELHIFVSYLLLDGLSQQVFLVDSISLNALAAEVTYLLAVYFRVERKIVVLRLVLGAGLGEFLETIWSLGDGVHSSDYNTICSADEHQ